MEGNSTKLVSGIKDQNGNWSIEGHQDRVINIGKKELNLFAKLYDKEGAKSDHARLPALHSKQLVNVLKSLVDKDKINEVFELFYSTMVDETGYQKDKIIKKQTKHPQNIIELIYFLDQYRCCKPII